MSDKLTEAFYQQRRYFVELFSFVANEFLTLAVYRLEEATNTILDHGTGLSKQGRKIKVGKFYQQKKDQSSDEDLAAEKLNHMNDEVDDIVDQLQEKMEKGEDVDFKEDEQSKKDRLGLAGMQKQMEAVSRLNLGLRSKAFPVLIEMQNKNILYAKSAVLKKNIKSLLHLIDKIDASLDDRVDCGEMVQAIYTQIEEKEDQVKFLCSFLDGVPIQDLAKITLNDLNNIPVTEPEFVLRFFDHYRQVLLDCVSYTESSTVEIGKALAVLLEDSDRIGAVSQESLDSIENLQEELLKDNDDQDLGSKQDKVNSALSAFRKVLSKDKSLQDLVNPILVALQFQDQLQQHLNNLSGFVNILSEVLSKKDEELIAQVYSLEHDTFDPLGLALYKLTTMEEERDILRKYFDGIPTKVEINEQDGQGINFLE